jgi:hypothetical protein
LIDINARVERDGKIPFVIGTANVDVRSHFRSVEGVVAQLCGSAATPI